MIVWVWFLFLVNLFQVSRSLESSVLLKVQDTVVALGAEATSVETPRGHHAVSEGATCLSCYSSGWAIWGFPEAARCPHTPVP